MFHNIFQGKHDWNVFAIISYLLKNIYMEKEYMVVIIKMFFFVDDNWIYLLCLQSFEITTISFCTLWCTCGGKKKLFHRSFSQNTILYDGGFGDGCGDRTKI